MRQIKFLAAHSHFNEQFQQQLKLASGESRTFSNPSLSSAVVHITPTQGLIGDDQVYEVSATCCDKDVQQLITVVLPTMAAPTTTMSRSCSVACSLMARELKDGTYLRTGDTWTPYDLADSLLPTLQAAAEVFEVPANDPRRQHSTCNNLDLKSASDSLTKRSSAPSDGSVEHGNSNSGPVCKDSEQIFRGVRARCAIPANVPIATYDGYCVTALDKVHISGSDSSAADTAYFQRFLLGPEQYSVAGRAITVYCYGSPLGRSVGPMTNDRSGTGKPINCGMGCLLRKHGKQVQLQDILLTVNRIEAGEELLVAYKHDIHDAAAVATARA